MRSEKIQKTIKDHFQSLVHFELEDESHNHAGRKGMESHFKLLLVSPEFENQNRVQRQRQINELLKEEFEQGLHALTMRLLTPGEYEKQVSSFQSPNCQSKN